MKTQELFQPSPDEQDDDQPVGRVLTRREMLALLTGVGGAMVIGGGLFKVGASQLVGTATPTLTATALPSCVVRPQLTEGPYFVDEMLNRSDIRIEPSDGSIKEGTLLKLIFYVSQTTSQVCAPLAGAQVDIWHCDALGVYSGVQDQSFNTKALTFLRGYQVTDTEGMAQFTTIYPGWYPGRTVHIHFKIRTDPASDKGYEFTSQLFFDEDVSDEVYKAKPYNTKGQRNTLNTNDGIYQQSGGQLLLDTVKTDEGYTATFNIGLDLSDTSTPANGGGGPAGGPPPGGRGPGGPGAPTPTPGS